MWQHSSLFTPIILIPPSRLIVKILDLLHWVVSFESFYHLLVVREVVMVLYFYCPSSSWNLIWDSTRGVMFHLWAHDSNLGGRSLRSAPLPATGRTLYYRLGIMGPKLCSASHFPSLIVALIRCVDVSFGWIRRGIWTAGSVSCSLCFLEFCFQFSFPVFRLPHLLL
jgi:hypothetical protein